MEGGHAQLLGRAAQGTPQLCRVENRADQAEHRTPQCTAPNAGYWGVGPEVPESERSAAQEQPATHPGIVVSAVASIEFELIVETATSGLVVLCQCAINPVNDF